MPEFDCREAALSEDFYDFLIAPQYLPLYGYDPDYCVQRINNTCDCVYVPMSDIPPVDMHNTDYTAVPKLYGLMEGTTTDQIRSIALQQENILDLDGEGVLIGFICSGINYQSPYFQNSDGSTRIAGIWDQTIQSGQAPDGIFYGSAYTQDDINNALASDNPLSIVPSTDTEGCGTYLASVAAASEDSIGNFRGVAPRASIGVVKLKEAKSYLKDFYAIRQDATAYQENDVMLAILYLKNLADQLSMPLIVCLGLGSSIGNHSNSSFLARYINAISIGRKCVVCGTGNEANRRHHFSGYIENDGDYIDVEVRVSNNARGFWMELWGISPDIYSVSVISPSGETLPRVPYRIGSGADYRFVFEQSDVSINYQVVGETIGNPLITMKMTNPANGIWIFRIFASSRTYGQFHMWLPISEFIQGETYFLASNPEMTLTDPAASIRSISVSAYDSQNNSIFVESGRGFTLTGLIKPYFAAPGVGVPGIDLRDMPTRRSGTAGSAALTAGACAIIFQWCTVLGNLPTLDFTQLTTLLVRGADRNPSRSYPNREWGYGSLNLAGTFDNFRPI